MLWPDLQNWREKQLCVKRRWRGWKWKCSQYSLIDNTLMLPRWHSWAAKYFALDQQHWSTLSSISISIQARPKSKCVTTEDSENIGHSPHWGPFAGGIAWEHRWASGEGGTASCTASPAPRTSAHWPCWSWCPPWSLYAGPSAWWLAQMPCPTPAKHNLEQIKGTGTSITRHLHWTKQI